jgi:hypothetical protein
MRLGVHLEELTAQLREQSTRAPVFNPLAVTKGNPHKSYLLDLAATGIPLPVTRLLPAGTNVDERDLRLIFGASAVAAKPAVGAGGLRMSRLPDVAAPALVPPAFRQRVVLEDAVVQEFLPAVHTAGERSLVVIAGQASHLVHKASSAWEFRVLASRGGTEHLVDTDEAGARVERAVLPLLAELAYARVDYVIDPQPGPLVMELERRRSTTPPTTGSPPTAGPPARRRARP